MDAGAQGGCEKAGGEKVGKDTRNKITPQETCDGRPRGVSLMGALNEIEKRGKVLSSRERDEQPRPANAARGGPQTGKKLGFA